MGSCFALFHPCVSVSVVPLVLDVMLVMIWRHLVCMVADDITPSLQGSFHIPFLMHLYLFLDFLLYIEGDVQFKCGEVEFRLLLVLSFFANSPKTNFL